jgi:hypothetical protein
MRLLYLRVALQFRAFRCRIAPVNDVGCLGNQQTQKETRRSKFRCRGQEIEQQLVPTEERQARPVYRLTKRHGETARANNTRDGYAKYATPQNLE